MIVRQEGSMSSVVRRLLHRLLYPAVGRRANGQHWKTIGRPVLFKACIIAPIFARCDKWDSEHSSYQTQSTPHCANSLASATSWYRLPQRCSQVMREPEVYLDPRGATLMTHAVDTTTWHTRSSERQNRAPGTHRPNFIPRLWAC